MLVTRRRLLALPPTVAALSLPLAALARESQRDVPYVPTPDELVTAMLDLAKVGPDDRLIDLGAGDGRIAHAAAMRGATALGIEIDAALVAGARRRAVEAELTGRLQYRVENLFDTPLRSASVVTLYLLPAINLRLRPRLLVELAAGTRIVSHAFDMGDWAADGQVEVDDRVAYLWIVPAVAGGEWRVTRGDAVHWLTIEQRFQTVSGTLDGAALSAATLRGRALAFTAAGRRWTAQVGDAAIVGDGWRAERADV